MAFAFLSENGFEIGTRGHFDAESDSGAALDFPHYSDLARVPGLPAPYRGAHCMRVNLALVSTSSYVQETGSWDTAGNNTIWFRWMMWFGGSPVMASDDLFSVFELWSATDTVEAAVFIQYTTANGYRLGVNETSAAASAAFLPLELNKWVCVELGATIDPGLNDGTLNLYVDGMAATQITSLNQGDITSGVMGVVGIDAGSTRGIVLFDEVIADNLQIYPPNYRFPDTLLMTASGHAFVGPGRISNISLLSGAGTDCVCAVHDTDVGNTNDASNIKAELKNTANNELVDPAGMPVDVVRGAYIALSGTNPRALVQIGRAVGYSSDAAIRSYAARRIAAPRNV